ncbi:MAG: FxsA family protein [Gammaproteobacteria bacterium]|nr:FxsA family protein [Gammaproteobacteria bacterium]
MNGFKVFGLVWLILELVVFFWIAHLIGLGWAILLIILSSLFGGVLMRRFGLANLQRAQLKMMQGEAPAREMFNVIAIVLGGIFMIIPGFISTAFGLFLLIPKLRDPVVNWVLRKSAFNMGQPTMQQSASEPQAEIHLDEGRTIEGEAWKE